MEQEVAGRDLRDGRLRLLGCARFYLRISMKDMLNCGGGKRLGQGKPGECNDTRTAGIFRYQRLLDDPVRRQLLGLERIKGGNPHLLKVTQLLSRCPSTRPNLKISPKVKFRFLDSPFPPSQSLHGGLAFEFGRQNTLALRLR